MKRVLLSPLPAIEAGKVERICPNGKCDDRTYPSNCAERDGNLQSVSELDVGWARLGQPHWAAKTNSLGLNCPQHLDRGQIGHDLGRYIPSLQQWIADKPLPVPTCSSSGAETGAGLLLPDGRAFYLGGNGNTVFYTPRGTTNFGSWLPDPAIPNGKILCALTSFTNKIVKGSIVLVTSLDLFRFFFTPMPVAQMVQMGAGPHLQTFGNP